MCDDGDDAIVPQEDSVCASLAVCLDSNRGYGLDSNRGYAICVGGSLLCLYVDIRRECVSVYPACHCAASRSKVKVCVLPVCNCYESCHMALSEQGWRSVMPNSCQ